MKDLAILMYWIDNGKQPTLEASLSNESKIPRDRQLILNELNNNTTLSLRETARLSRPHKAKEVPLKKAI